MNGIRRLRSALAKVVLAGSLAVLLLGSSLPAFSSPAVGDPDPNTLKMSGSTTVYPIVETSKTRFPNTAPGAIINATQGGSGVGKTDILNGVTDVGMSSSSCSSPADDINKGTTYRCSDLTKTTVGRDAVSIIVNANAPCSLTSLSKTDLQQIWGTTPGYTNWNQLPGCSVNQPLRIIAREIGSGTRQSFLELIPITDANEQAKITAHGERKNGSPAVEAAVNNDPNAIGYAGLHFVGGNNRGLSLDYCTWKPCPPSPLPPVWPPDWCPGCPPTGPIPVPPISDRVVDGYYPLSRGLFLFTLPVGINPKPLIQTYLTWSLAEEAQGIVQNEGYVPVGPVAADWDINLDHTCDIGDVAVIGISWQENNAVAGWIRADANWDTVVDIGDVALVGVNWLQGW
jgi:phosphate transport system substrate-binding protein